MSFADRFGRLTTAAKLLLILTAILLPIGIALAWLGDAGIRQANKALDGRNQDQSFAAAKSVESLIARNALALRVAAAGGLQAGGAAACDKTASALTTAPAIAQKFSLRKPDGTLICTYGAFVPKYPTPIVAPGDVRVWIDPDGQGVAIRVGVEGGMATASISKAEMRAAAIDAPGTIQSFILRDGDRDLTVVPAPADPHPDLTLNTWPVGQGTIRADVGTAHDRITTGDRLMLLLPLLMWVAAALVTWLLVSRLLIRPLKRLESAVRDYHPGQAAIELPDKLGPSTEIQQLRDAFERAVSRVDESERQMSSALDGQRRLVREVHHRVKNNLQVVASLLNIHGRSAETGEARAAYAGIGRRVGALSIVHRNHFAEMEENRGIAVRPLISELAAELRAGAPDSARGLAIDLDLDTVNTTQDAAVAVAFLITEIVEYSMLNCPTDPVEIALRRTGDLSARLTLASPVLVPDDDAKPEKAQFERIIAGLAKQLRSSLDRKLGRYSVDFPVFPPL